MLILRGPCLDFLSNRNIVINLHHKKRFDFEKLLLTHKQVILFLLFWDSPKNISISQHVDKKLYQNNFTIKGA